MARRLGVSREDVIAAAVSIGDRAGLEGLTVAAVAAEVGCRPPSVYHHVEGLDGLVRAVTLIAAGDLIGQLELAAADTHGLERLRAMLLAAHRWGTEHPARFDALRRPVDPDTDPELAAARAAVLLPVQDVLVELGVPTEQRAPLLAALVAAVRGCIAADVDAGTGRAGSDVESSQLEHARLAKAPLDGTRAEGHQLLVGLLLDHVDAIRPAVAP